MTIITYCNHCGCVIAILGAIIGDIPTNTFMNIRLDDADLKCKGCTSNNVSLRIIGNDCTLGREISA